MQVLYRKYRPQDFNEVLGQEHIVDALLGALKKNAVAHAYLFSGSRGTGKTSVARIFARRAGCSDKDIYEIDAASNRGIDDIRELREAVSVLPFESPYKAYIIDEVHMLTKEAFNALLKTLEEPPSHALFLLATTEYGKLPETITSRCQCLAFKKPPRDVLVDMVKRVAKKEAVSLSGEAARMIGERSGGSFRDALGLLQKVIASSAGTVDAESVLRAEGVPPSARVRECVAALCARDASSALRAVADAAHDGVDMKAFCTEVVNTLRAILLLRHAPEMEGVLREEHDETHFAFLLEMARSGEGKTITARTLKAFLDAHQEIGFAAIPSLPLEIALITLCAKTK